ncbi:cell envelope biogenesis protein TolA [Bradyrhizobium neotropicale]|uniref:cell envelope biogenesis protein TolA n=1 Tax=Bradyrhizobium neotropicale TaxID=1497615 RepID=UPI0028A00A6B|nr:cell envelope biogenesis protein TolA [Bradyrhizobium neotropicale]
MAAPGVVLKRPVGSRGAFKEHAELPSNLAGGSSTKANRRSASRKPQRHPKPTEDEAAERKAAIAFEREQKRRERERAKEEAARRKERERRQEAVDKAQSALDAARREHEENAADLRAELELIEEKVQAEEARWEKEKARLEAALRRARG